MGEMGGSEGYISKNYKESQPPVSFLLEILLSFQNRKHS